MNRPQFLSINNGEKAKLPFSDMEYARRLARLRCDMATAGVDACLFTSMQNIAYFSGFLYCSFGRPYGCVITPDESTTVSANIDYGQPARRSYGANLVYTDWQRDNYFAAAASLLGSSKRVGIEFDHVNLAMRDALHCALPGVEFIDISAPVMAARMVKSDEEIELIKAGAAVADIGGYAIRDAITQGASELAIAQTGRAAMEAAIAARYPDSELRDTWVWFQSGLNTDGAHNPVTTRQLHYGDILSLNTFPMISGYYTALERTLFVGDPSPAHLAAWELNVKVHNRGLELLKPGAKCSDICSELNAIYADAGMLNARTFGYGHSFGILSHYYGREAGLELREDINTVLEPGMVVSMEPMITIPNGQPGAGGYREHDILVLSDSGSENITRFPYGPEHNIIATDRLAKAS
jgi:creatinase